MKKIENSSKEKSTTYPPNGDLNLDLFHLSNLASCSLSHLNWNKRAAVLDIQNMLELEIYKTFKVSLESCTILKYSHFPIISILLSIFFVLLWRARLTLQYTYTQFSPFTFAKFNTTALPFLQSHDLLTLWLTARFGQLIFIFHTLNIGN